MPFPCEYQSDEMISLVNIPTPPKPLPKPPAPKPIEEQLSNLVKVVSQIASLMDGYRKAVAQVDERLKKLEHK